MNNYVKNYLKTHLVSPIIIEAGTASGYDTEMFCEMFPEGMIYGFEPIPLLYQQTKEKVSKFKNIHLINKALSDKKQTISMFVADINNNICESSSLLPPKDHLIRHPHVSFKNNIEVETIDLNSFVQEFNIESIDLMWLDLQGYEPFVLQHSVSTLLKTKYLFTEINLIEVYKKVILWPEFEKFLNSQGFETIWSDITPGVDAANALLINSNI